MVLNGALISCPGVNRRSFLIPGRSTVNSVNEGNRFSWNAPRHDGRLGVSCCCIVHRAAFAYTVCVDKKRCCAFLIPGDNIDNSIQRNIMYRPPGPEEHIQTSSITTTMTTGAASISSRNVQHYA